MPRAGDEVEREEPEDRGGNSTPAPGWVHRDDEAGAQWADRRHRFRPRLLEWDHPLGSYPAAEGHVGRTLPTLQLVPLRMAMRRPYRRAARPQPGRGQLGPEGQSDQGDGDGRAE